MFVVVTLDARLGLPFFQAQRSRREIIEEKLTNIYTNSIIPGAGLGLYLKSIENYGDEFVYPSADQSYIDIKFKFVCFRPRPGDILHAFIVHQDPEGISISMGFFRDIYIPKHYLYEGSYWDPETEKFHATGPDFELEYNNGQIVKFRVIILDFDSNTIENIKKRSIRTRNTENNTPKLLAPISRQMIIAQHEHAQDLAEEAKKRSSSSNSRTIATKKTKRNSEPITHPTQSDRIKLLQTADDSAKEEVLDSVIATGSKLGLQGIEEAVKIVPKYSRFPDDPDDTSSSNTGKMEIIGSFQTAGLGPVEWWHPSEDSEEEDSEEEEGDEDESGVSLHDHHDSEAPDSEEEEEDDEF